MIDTQRLASFLLVVVTLIVVPGPSVLFVVSRGVSLGRRAAVFTALGNESAMLVQVLAVACGLGFVVERSVVVFSVLKFAGAGYLVYLGWQAWRHRGDLAVAVARPTSSYPSLRILRDGFVVGIGNPKGVLIFTAVLPQFVDRSAGGVPGQLLVLGLICVAIALVSDVSWGLLAGTARSWLARSPRRLSAIGGASGVVMMGLGLKLAVSRRP
ncbi:putative threonine efflux protein [Frankia torreyi]|uniref:Putative threonine efflux protein n=2 Tax=Frankia TaxID=1854 RepID=A0A0D8B7X4_9ACTN|nr:MULTISPECIES: LysE family translocator [Frankia]KJE19487.1 putative threonine efflux protein [Frankia torreyi]KQM01933.1 putative threonine efflux protein [Frankia sp. CpI1-P]